jgi:preprotein translocase subunit SecD
MKDRGAVRNARPACRTGDRPLVRWIGALVGLAGLLLASVATADALKLDVRGVGFSRENGRVILTITVVNAQAFGEFTAQNVGRRTEFRTDGKPVVASIIREPILDGRVEIGFVTYTEAAAAERLLQQGSTVQVDVIDR